MNNSYIDNTSMNNSYIDNTSMNNSYVDNYVNLNSTLHEDIFDENITNGENTTNYTNEEDGRCDKLMIALLICCGAPIIFCVCLILSFIKELFQDLIDKIISS